MKMNIAYRTLEDLLSKSRKKSDGKIYQQLIGALNNLKERDLTPDQLQFVEEAIDRLRLNDVDEMSTRELKSRRNRFMKQVSKTLSLIPEGHYMALGLCFGVAFGGAISVILQGFSGAPQSSTGLVVGIGLIAGYIVGSYLDVEAGKQNRVLTTQTS